MTEEYFSISDIARREAMGFVKLDDDLCAIGDRLGVPKYWGFGSEKFFASYMGFGSVEIHFRSVNDVVRVKYIELQLSKFSGLTAPFSKSSNGERTYFKLPCSKAKLDFNFVFDLFQSSGIEFQVGAAEPVSGETTATLRVGQTLSFYFSGKHKILEVISIS